MSKRTLCGPFVPAGPHQFISRAANNGWFVHDAYQGCFEAWAEGAALVPWGIPKPERVIPRLSEKTAAILGYLRPAGRQTHCD